jgi:hypothetical protein
MQEALLADQLARIHEDYSAAIATMPDHAAFLGWIGALGVEPGSPA